jgi:predicted DNA binding CopG/RHH family protein
MSKESGATAKTTLRLRLDLLTEVRHRAIDEGLTLQAIVERALAAYLKTPIRSKGKNR